VACRVGNAITSAVTLNISRRGLAIRTTSPPELGAVLKVRFRLPAGSHEVDTHAQVVWATRGIGMGLRLDALSPVDEAAIEAFVDGHFFSNRKA
jgi:hypothetical protein